MAKIAVDAMGGDYAPAAVVEGALLASPPLRLGQPIVSTALVFYSF